MNDEFIDQYGPWALITGGSEGVGAEWGEACARRGLNIVITARRPEVLERQADRLRSLGVQAKTVVADITAPDLSERLHESTDGLEIGLVVHNVGSWDRNHGWFLDDPLDTGIKTIEVNCVAPVKLVHAFGKQMRDRKRGGIVLISSLAGIAGQPLEATYSAAKAFSQHFAEALWSEFSEFGVHVVCIPLGGTRTPALESKSVVGLDGLPTSQEVVQDAIEHLADGPVYVPIEANRRFFDRVSSLSRREAAESMARLAYRSIGRPE